MDATGIKSLVFIDHVIADKSSRMNSEMYRDILSAQIQPNIEKNPDQAELHSANV